MTTISSTSSPVSAVGYTALAASSAVSSASSAGLSQEAVSLAADAGVIATLGTGASGSQTYDAAGLLNAFIQAENSSSSTSQTNSTANSQSSSQQSSSQSAAGSSTTSPTSSGVYNSSGILQTDSSGLSSNWASLLKANPALASTVIQDSITQGIVGTL